MSDFSRDAVRSALEDLTAWVDRNGPAGFDPYDVLGKARFYRLTHDDRGRMRRTATARALMSARHRWPVPTRRVFGVRPAVNAKGVGLMLSARLRMERLGMPGSLETARELAAWLALNPSRAGFPGASWGYPFHWHTRIFVPADTPSAVVTATCGQGLLDFAERTDDERAVQTARGAAVFLAEGLNRTELGDGRVCLSYTPLDDFQVHNANLMAAEYLLRAGRFFGEPTWQELATACMRFTVSFQAQDGSFEYWAPDQQAASQIDNYHTGFVLRSLFAFAEANRSQAAGALDSGWAFYAREFLSSGGKPRNDVGRDDRLDIHSCAESVLCPAVLSIRYPDAFALSRAAADWTVANMRNPDGSFVHGVWGERTRTMPYLRWGQAWMMRALSELLVREESAESAATSNAPPDREIVQPSAEEG
ncbi:MAG: hypothetical protein OEV43_08605 [Coriobacteriia bacterium]|nr:hypothetical protein [Coriobacteriia bacterium]